ncbi:MAG: hypothetical protein PHF86_10970 [Candidatus Nanoarchaeia archaeon]|nr:hypothetical protein [Candidatus Nanoarchaeia archaeon]
MKKFLLLSLCLCSFAFSQSDSTTQPKLDTQSLNVAMNSSIVQALTEQQSLFEEQILTQNIFNTLSIIAGVSGLAFTIADGSKDCQWWKDGKLTDGTKWTSTHTATAILSSSLILSSAISIDFNKKTLSNLSKTNLKLITPYNTALQKKESISKSSKPNIFVIAGITALTSVTCLITSGVLND